MSEVFLPQLDVPNLLLGVVDQGWAFEPDGITRWLCDEIVSVVDDLPLTRFSKHSPQVDVETDSYVFRLTETMLPYSVRLLHEKLTQRVRMGAPSKRRQLRLWLPNEITVQRFTKPGDQVSKHQDFSHDKELIVVCTVEGSGPFNLYRDRGEDQPKHVCETASGSMAFMTAASLDGCGSDHRPVHEAAPAHSLPRTTVTFRMVVGDKPR